MTKFGKLFLITIAIGIVAVVMIFKTNSYKDESINCKNQLATSYNEQSWYLAQIDELTQTISGLQNTGVQEQEAVEIPEELSTVLHFPEQPTEAIGSYEWNTQVLNNYSSNTRQIAELTQDFKGQMIIKLRKAPTIHTVIYFKTDSIYCGGRLNEELNENNEFVLDMKAPIKVGKANCVLSHNGQLPEKITIGWYVANFDWNGIESITIK